MSVFFGLGNQCIRALPPPCAPECGASILSDKNQRSVSVFDGTTSTVSLCRPCFTGLCASSFHFRPPCVGEVTPCCVTLERTCNTLKRIILNRRNRQLLSPKENQSRLNYFLVYSPLLQRQDHCSLSNEKTPRSFSVCYIAATSLSATEKLTPLV